MEEAVVHGHIALYLLKFILSFEVSDTLIGFILLQMDVQQNGKAGQTSTGLGVQRVFLDLEAACYFPRSS